MCIYKLACHHNSACSQGRHAIQQLLLACAASVMWSPAAQLTLQCSRSSASNARHAALQPAILRDPVTTGLALTSTDMANKQSHHTHFAAAATYLALHQYLYTDLREPQKRSEETGCKTPYLIAGSSSQYDYVYNIAGHHADEGLMTLYNGTTDRFLNTHDYRTDRSGLWTQKDTPDANVTTRRRTTEDAK